jgi:hypothetical protein
MNLGMKRALAWCLAVVVAAVVWSVPGTPSGSATTCQRTVAIAPEVSVGEGAGTLQFAVHSAGCAVAGSVAYTVEAGTAQVPADFVLPDGELDWGIGDDGPRSINATITSDLIPEADLEDFTVELTDPSPGIQISTSTGHGRILDDDDLWLTWVVDDGICDPRECLTFDVHDKWHPIQLNVAFVSTSPVTVHWSTADGTAHAGEDFVGVTNQLVTVPAGADGIGLPVRFLPAASAGSFSVRIFAPSAGRIVDGTAVITIGRP